MARVAARAFGLPGRLAATVVLVYALHFAPNVVRETYLAVAVAERGSIDVTPFVGLHPDLFAIPGRGAYINSNPGASFIGAIPYAVVRPALELLYRARPALVAPKPPTTYDDPRPNRTRFMNEMRARGLDVRLALAAAAMFLGLNVPTGALAALAVFFFLRARLRDERLALWLALLFAFGTPVFFRSAFLNQNLVLAHCTLLAYLALVWRNGEAAAAGGRFMTSGTTTAERTTAAGRKSAPARLRPGRLGLAGALLGVGLVCDYSAVSLLLVFGAWAAAIGVRDEGLAAGLRSAGAFAAGAAGPVAVLLLYQYAAFGNPFLPAQTYMPGTDLSLAGWHGLRLPSPDLLWRNLVDPGYGLFAFCPMLVASVLAPRYCGRRGGVDRDSLALIYGASLALYLFSSSVAFAALQGNTGVRYLVPAVPLLFFALVPVLVNAPRWVSWLIVVPTLAISWCVSMARESVTTSLLEIAARGPELPWHTVLRKTAPAYAPALSSGFFLAAVFLAAGVALRLVWTAPPAPRLPC